MDDQQPPASHLEVPPTSVAARGRRRPVAILALGLAVVAGAVWLAQLDGGVTAPPLAAASAAPSGAPSPFARVSLGPGPVAAIPPRLRPADLAERVEAGTLDWRLVFIDGEIRATPVVCGPDDEVAVPGAPGCIDLAMPGVGPPVVLASTAVPWLGDPPAGAWLVTVPIDGELRYLGSLLPDNDTATSIPELTRRLAMGEGPPDAGTLFQVSGWLYATEEPFLSPDPPNADGTLPADPGTPIAIEQPLVDVDPHALASFGTLLVGLPDACAMADAWPSCLDDAPLLAVARYEPSHAFRVQVP